MIVDVELLFNIITCASNMRVDAVKENMGIEMASVSLLSISSLDCPHRQVDKMSCLFIILFLSSWYK
jgi:hypothetical protein